MPLATTRLPLCLALFVACGPAKDPGADDAQDTPGADSDGPEDSVGDSVDDSDVDSIDSVADPVGDSVGDSVEDSVGDSVDSDTVTDSVDTPAADTPVDTAPTPPTPFHGTTGGFVDVTAALWATGEYVLPPEDESDPLGIPGTGVPTFGDPDSDGVEELVIHGVRLATAPPNSTRLVAFEPDGAGGWVYDEPLTTQLIRRTRTAPGVIADLDDDGDDDIVRSSVYDGLLDLNTGGTLGPGEVITPIGSFIRGLRSPTLVDFDNDGWLDIINSAYACGQANPWRVFAVIRTGVARWEVMPDLIPDSHDGNAFSLLYGNFGGDDTLVFLGDACSTNFRHPGFYVADPRRADGYATWTAYDAVPADAWFRLFPDGWGQPLTRRQPMGGANFDFDGDGTLDLVISPSDSYLYMFRGNGTRMFTDASNTIPALLERGPVGDPKLPWGVAVIDVDRDGWHDMIVGRGDDARVYTQGVAYNGPYQPSAFWNHGGQGFEEGRDVLGLSAIQTETQTLWAGDYDHDGDRDVFVGGTGTFPRVLRNDVVAPGANLILRLHGTTSNHLAAGAIIHLQAPGLPAQQWRVGSENTTNALGDYDVFLAAGDANTVPSVQITWPAGWTQTLTDVPTGALQVIEEPPTITLSEADRHLPGDGLSELVVRVEPRADDGSLRAASVSVEVAGGAPITWTGPIVPDGLAWTRTMLAPVGPGSTVVEVQIDGVPLKVRPRVWWD